MGLLNAITELNSLDRTQVWNRTVELANYMREQLAMIEELQVLDMGKIKCGIVTLNADRISPFQLKERLQLESINTSVAVKSSTLIDMERRNLEAVLRVSVHYYNTHEEIDIFVRSLKKIIAKP